MKYLFIISTLFLLSCGTSQQEEKTVDSTAVQVSDSVTSSVKDTLEGNKDVLTYQFVLNKSLPPYTIYVHMKENTFLLVNEDKKVIQTFAVPDEVDFGRDYYHDPSTFISGEDFNFDGYKDLMLLSSSGTGGYWYDIYLYDKSYSKFFPHEGLSKLTSPSVDTINQTVKMYDIGGMAGAWYSFVTYKWENTELVPIREEVQSSESPDSEVFIRTISVPGPDGKMKVVSSVKIDQYGEKERHCLQEGEWEEFDKNPNYLFVETAEEVIRVDGRNGECDE